MADQADIDFVRRNIGTSDLTDEQLGEYVDAYGVSCAIGQVWLEKAAAYAEMVDTAESGASLKLSDLSKNALAMAKQWCPGGVIDGGAAGAPGLVIRQIIREPGVV